MATELLVVQSVTPEKSLIFVVILEKSETNDRKCHVFCCKVDAEVVLFCLSFEGVHDARHRRNNFEVCEFCEEKKKWQKIYS